MSAVQPPSGPSAGRPGGVGESSPIFEELAIQEEWRVIPGFPKYEVSNIGHVRNVATGYVRKPAETKTHLILTLPRDDGSKTTLNVGALVLMAFVGPRPAKHDTSHLNGNFRDNRLDNLAWETRKENCQRKIEHGTNIAPRGADHPKAKLNEAKVQDIRTRLADGARVIDLAREHSVAKSLIWAIRERRIWAWV